MERQATSCSGRLHERQRNIDGRSEAVGATRGKTPDGERGEREREKRGRREGDAAVAENATSSVFENSSSSAFAVSATQSEGRRHRAAEVAE